MFIFVWSWISSYVSKSERQWSYSKAWYTRGQCAVIFKVSWNGIITSFMWCISCWKGTVRNQSSDSTNGLLFMEQKVVGADWTGRKAGLLKNLSLLYAVMLLLYCRFWVCSVFTLEISQNKRTQNSHSEDEGSFHLHQSKLFKFLPFSSGLIQVHTDFLQMNQEL